MLFQYKAVKPGGEEVKGEQEAPDRFALAHRVKEEKGLVLIEAHEQRAADRQASLITRLNTLLFKIKIKDQVIFAGSLSAMLGAGLSLSRGLAVMERQTGNKQFKNIISDIAKEVSEGASLSRALSKYSHLFPPVFIAMVAAGEESGKLPEALESVKQQLAKSHDLQRKVKGAMIYPVIVITVIIIIGILMMIFLVPQLTALFNDLEVELPLSTRIVIGASNFLQAHTFSFIGALLLIVVAGWRTLKTVKGKRFFTKIFMRTRVVASIIKNFNSALTMRTLSSLISSGVGLTESLNITTRVVQNPFYQNVLVTAVDKISKGSTLSSIFQANEKIYPVLVGEMAEVGEETGNFAGMLLKGATFFEEEVEQATKNLSTLIEPALMILIGIAVGFFAVSMLGPMYSLSDKI